MADKKPFGVEDELAGALESLPGAARRPRLVLLLRDILDSAESTTRIWRKNNYFEAITTYYDQVLVVGYPEAYDLRREYEFPPFAAAKVSFCGYIAREPGRVGRDDTRRQLGVTAGEPLLLVTPGGGEDGHGLVSAALQALAAMHPAERPRTHIVCGPEMSEARRSSVQTSASPMRGVSVQDFSDDMMSLMGAADVVLAMGGYNTVCELLTLQRRAVLVPRVRPGTEQCIRAQRMASLDLVRTVHPDELTPATLQQALQAELTALARGQSLPRLRRLDGLVRVTRALFELIGLDIEPAPKATPLSTGDALPRPAPGVQRPMPGAELRA